MKIFSEYYQPKGLKFVSGPKINHKPKLINPNGKIIRHSHVDYDYWFAYKGRGIPFNFEPGDDIKSKFEKVFNDLQLEL